MAIESPPWALQSGSFNAEQTRRAVFSWAARTAANSPGIVSGGIYSASDCQLQAPASGLAVQITPGEILIPGNEGGSQGPGYARVTSTSSLSLAAADPTNPRIDLICATMSDAAYTEPTGGSGSQWALQALTGTPTAGTTLSSLAGAPSLPGSSLLLGYVLVPAGATSIVSGDIANKSKVVTPGFFGTTSIGDGQPMVYNGTTSQWRSLAAGTGNATFLQLLSPQTLQLEFGTGSVTWNGSSAGASTTVSYSLGGRTAQVVLLGAGEASTAAQAQAMYYGLTSSSFTVQMEYANAGTPPNGTTAGFSWAVIG